MAVSAKLTSLSTRRRFFNDATRYLVAAGGAAVVAAIALIFFYLLWVILPIFTPASIESDKVLAIDSPSAYLDVSESGEIGLSLGFDGEVQFFDIEKGTILHREALNIDVAKVKPVLPSTAVYAVADDENSLHIISARYLVSFSADVRKLSPELQYPYEDEPIDLGNMSDFDVYQADTDLIIATIKGRQLNLIHYRDVEPGFALERPRKGKLNLERAYSQVYFGPRARWLYLIDDVGRVELIDLKRPTSPKPLSEARLVPEGTQLTAFTPLLGRYSLMAGDDRNKVTQWFVVRDDYGYNLHPVREFPLPAKPVSLIPEQRRKGFAVLDETGGIHLGYATTGKMVASSVVGVQSPALMNIAPRADLMLIGSSNGNIELLDLENKHPEISWRTLWSKIWYEGYKEPVYSWQSSSADNDFEPKFSLTPLIFGTLKAAFYAMIIAAPLAIMGALYTAYFMAPSMRRLVKPSIEIMAALPTVILGFMAGLWLAPVLESNLMAVLSILLVLPLGMLLLAWLWSKLPSQITRPTQGWYGLIAVVPLILLIVLAFEIGPFIEQTLFDGNSRAWLLNELGLSYDQRNALVVGLAMGLAVVPTIFSIAEDAIYGVPTHLINGSLALGATPWQTLVRVVLLTASPGIFSAVMIGLGRAVGETMIVLMATGNTPIMDMNIFEGMRTFAANIAVELPESEVASTHYRILFLTAMVLFGITFLFNTIAELVRQRLRDRYGNL